MITYPVSPNDRFTIKQGGVTLRNLRWPRADGMEIEHKDPAVVILREITASLPSFDSATHKLDAGTWIDDEVNQTATFTRSVVALTPEEIAAAADNQARESKKDSLAQAISSLRQWADQAGSTTVTSGNAVTTLQTVVTRLGVFFDRFADLLEVHRIDQ